MRLSLAATWSALLSSTSAGVISSTEGTDALAAKGLLNLAVYKAHHGSKTCTLKNAAIRREWGSLSKAERKHYTNSVNCLLKKPSQLDPAVVPGAKNRYDDFVWVHINQTFSIHATANFLSWHRYFTYLFEQALRNECGYRGYQPYWNWGRWAAHPLHSPIFDGSEYSVSGNGVYAKHNCTNALPTGLNCIPPGEGGGCLKSGPFKDMKVNLGPVSPSLAIDGLAATANNGTIYNPRCIRRDISSWVSSRFTTDLNSTRLIRNSPDILTFQNAMQGTFAIGEFGVHAGGHYTVGGDPGGDFFASPGDPAFWLHHGQIDRTWWVWQNQDVKARKDVIAGTITLFNEPPSRNGTLDDAIEMGVLGRDVRIRDLTSTTEGPLCYIYI